MNTTAIAAVEINAFGDNVQVPVVDTTIVEVLADGFTFPSNNPHKRIDFIFINSLSEENNNDEFKKWANVTIKASKIVGKHISRHSGMYSYSFFYVYIYIYI